MVHDVFFVKHVCEVMYGVVCSATYFVEPTANALLGTHEKHAVCAPAATVDNTVTQDTTPS